MSKNVLIRPLTGFLETKYPEVYDEYKKLYTWLDENHPQAQNLSKTSSFKTWKASVQYHQRASENTPTVKDNNNNDREKTASENTSTTSDNNNTREKTVSENTSTTSDNNNNDREKTASENTHAVNDNNNNDRETTVSENTPAANNNDVSIEELADIMVNIEGQVDQIINELRQDADLRQIMDEVERHTDQAIDEGIEISPLDDVEFDIQPFDFEVEVENYPW